MDVVAKRKLTVDAYLIFVISFTQTRLLEKKIYTEKMRNGLGYLCGAIL